MLTPEFDNYAEHCGAEIIETFQPDLMFIHFSYVDHQRHQNGVKGEKVNEALRFVDDKIRHADRCAQPSEFIGQDQHRHPGRSWSDQCIPFVQSEQVVL